MAYDDGGFGAYGENAAPSGNAMADFGLSAGNQLGLSAPTLSGMGINLGTGSQAGLQAPGFAANVGKTAFGTYGEDPGMMPDYVFSGKALEGMASLGKASYGLQPTGYEGLQANANTRGYNMSPTTQTVGLEGTQPTPGFFDTPAGKVVQTIAGFIPIVGNIFNSAVNFSKNQDPVQALLGLIPGVAGFAASTAYNASQSRDPLGFLGEQAVGAGANMLGGALGGRIGATGASQLAGGLMGNAAAERASYGPFGNATLGNMQQASAQQSLMGQMPDPNFTGPGNENAQASLLLRRLATNS
jgi:hypothetical protein